MYISLLEDIPNHDVAIFTAGDELTVVITELDCADASRMAGMFLDQAAGCGVPNTDWTVAASSSLKLTSHLGHQLLKMNKVI